MPPRTAAATERTKQIHADARARDPRKLEPALRTVGAAVANGTLTPADVLAAAEIARTARRANTETLSKVRALLPAVAPALDGEAA